MKKIYFLAILSIIVWSCGGGFNPEEEKNKILDVHDEVMPKIGEVMNLKRKVLDKANSIAESQEEQANELRDLAKELDDANNDMMVWMRDWSKNSSPYLNMTAGDEEQVKYLADEMKRVSEVKEAINSSIAKANEALK